MTEKDYFCSYYVIITHAFVVKRSFFFYLATGTISVHPIKLNPKTSIPSQAAKTMFSNVITCFSSACPFFTSESGLLWIRGHNTEVIEYIQYDSKGWVKKKNQRLRDWWGGDLIWAKAELLCVPGLGAFQHTIRLIWGQLAKRYKGGSERKKKFGLTCGSSPTAAHRRKEKND